MRWLREHRKGGREGGREQHVGRHALRGAHRSGVAAGQHHVEAAAQRTELFRDARPGAAAHNHGVAAGWGGGGAAGGEAGGGGGCRQLRGDAAKVSKVSGEVPGELAILPNAASGGGRYDN